MKLKRILSAAAALAVAVSSFAGMSITADADTQNNVTYDFSSATGMPTWTTNRVSATVVPEDDTTIETVSGDKGVVEFTTGSNSGNVYSYARYDFSDLVRGATTYTVSYKVYFTTDTNLRGVVGIVDTAAREDINAKTVSTTGMLGSVGAFSGEDFLRMASGGERGFLTNRSGNNCWITVSTTVTGENYETSITGTSTVKKSGTIASAGCTNAPTALEVLVYNPLSAALIDIDDIAVTATIPDIPQVKYTLSATTGDTSTVIKTGSGDQNSTIVAGGLPEVVKSDETYYRLSDNTVSNYKKEISLGTTDYTGTVNYTADNNIVYFDDAAAGTWVYGTSNDEWSGGNASSYGNNMNVAEIKLPTGKYNVLVKVAAKAGSGSNYRGEGISVAGTEVATIAEKSSKLYTIPITVTENESVVAVYGKSTNKATDYIDYVLIEKLAPEIASVEVNTAVTINGTDITPVGETTGTAPTAGEYVTSYLIKVDNYETGVPSLTTPTVGAETLTPSSEVIYGYAGSDGSYYFVIQTIGIDRATKAMFGTSEYDIAAE